MDNDQHGSKTIPEECVYNCDGYTFHVYSHFGTKITLAEILANRVMNDLRREREAQYQQDIMAYTPTETEGAVLSL